MAPVVNTAGARTWQQKAPAGAWVVKADKVDEKSVEAARPRAWSGSDSWAAKSSSDAWAPKGKGKGVGQRARSWSDPEPQVASESMKELKEVYSRGLLLQLHPSCCTPSTSAASSDSPGSSPRSQASLTGLYCATLEQLQASGLCNDEAPTLQGRQRANSAPPVGADADLESEGLAAAPPGLDDPGNSTVMLCGIPAGYSRTALCERFAEQGFGHTVDFLYLPRGKDSDQNAGHGFVNLTTKDAYQDFFKAFHNVKASSCLSDFPGDEVCKVSKHNVQGRDRNLEKLCTPANLVLWAEHGESWQPLFLDDSGKRMVLPVGRPRAASEPRAEAQPMCPSPQEMLMYMQMQQMQAQWQMQMMQKQMLWQKKMAKQQKVKMSASSPEFKPAASPEFKPGQSLETEMPPAEMRAEAAAFVPSV